MLKEVCRRFTLLCKRLDLFGGEFISIDGSKFEAVNGKNNNSTKEGLQKLVSKIDDRISTYFHSLDEADQQEQDDHKPDDKELKEKIASLSEVKQRYESLLEQLADSGEKQISLTDPDSRLMKVGNTGKEVCCNAQIAVDEKHKLIVANEVINSGSDRTSLSEMAKAAKATLEVETLEASADKGYHSMKEIQSCVEAGITPLVPRPKQSYNKPRGLYPKSDFIYDPSSDTYFCPGGATMTYRSTVVQSDQPYRIYGTPACYKCKIKNLCTDNKKARRLFRLEGEHLLDEMGQRLKERPEVMEKRRCLVEYPFGTLKRWMGYHYFLMKGLENVRMEFALSVMAYNLKRVINIIGVKNLIESLQAAAL